MFMHYRKQTIPVKDQIQLLMTVILKIRKRFLFISIIKSIMLS